LYLVGVAGFEPTTTTPPVWCALTYNLLLSLEILPNFREFYFSPLLSTNGKLITKTYIFLRGENQMSEQKLRADFSRRLNEILDEKDFPAKYEGRQIILSHDLKVSQISARNWLEGFAIPRDSSLKKLAANLGVNFLWLRYGEQPKYSLGPVTERKKLLHQMVDKLDGDDEKYAYKIISAICSEEG